jgi:hypothetical protein
MFHESHNAEVEETSEILSLDISSLNIMRTMLWEAKMFYL